MDLFYDPEFDANSGLLSKEESHHCIRVLRHKKGDYIGVTNGKGRICHGIIDMADPSSVIINIQEIVDTPPPSFRITLAVGLLKNNDRMEWMVEKCTELGVSRIIPFTSRFGERKKENAQRLIKKSISAIKQSGNPFLPMIDETIDWKELIKMRSQFTQSYLAYLGNTSTLRMELATTGDILVIIGPEGGLSTEENKEALDSGFIPITLGSYILRTETAAITAMALLAPLK